MNALIKKTGITFGIILSVYYIIFNIILFFTDATYFTKPVIGLVNMGVVVVLGILVVFFSKRKLNNLITLKEAFSSFLIMILIGFTVNISLIFILFNFVNPEAQIAANQLLLDQVSASLNASGLAPNEIAEKLEMAKTYNNFSIETQLYSLAGSILRASLAGLLISLIFRNKSEFTTPIQPKQ